MSYLGIKQNKGFTFIEVLVVVSLVGVLSAIALANYHMFSSNALDKSALSDYRHIKVALLDVIADQNGSNRIVIRNAVGPATLPAPLTMVKLSPNVRASVVHVTRYRNNRRPRTNTTIDVYNREGTTRYRYTERNGLIVEQEIELRN